MQWLQVAVLILPVVVPVVDANERALRTVGQRCGRLDLPGEVMSVRIDGEEVHGDRKPIAVADDVRGCAGRDIDRQRVEHHGHRLHRCRRLGIVQPDLWPHRNGFGAGQQVELQDEVGAGREWPREAVGVRGRDLARRPAENVAAWEFRGIDHEPVVARQRIRRVEIACSACRIDHHARVMNRPGRARPQFNGANPAKLLQRHGQHELPIDVGRAGREDIRLRQLDDEVRCAEVPTVPSVRRSRARGPRTLKGPKGGPSCDKVDLGLRQAPFPLKRPYRGGRLPRRHGSAAGHRSDERGALARRVVVEQAEWTDAARPVARHAVLEEDRCNRLRIGDRCLRAAHGARPGPHGNREHA